MLLEVDRFTWSWKNCAPPTHGEPCTSNAECAVPLVCLPSGTSCGIVCRIWSPSDAGRSSPFGRAPGLVFCHPPYGTSYGPGVDVWAAGVVARGDGGGVDDAVAVLKGPRGLEEGVVDAVADGCEDEADAVPPLEDAVSAQEGQVARLHQRVAAGAGSHAGGRYRVATYSVRSCPIKRARAQALRLRARCPPASSA